MPWIEGNFAAVADSGGTINYKRRLSSPLPFPVKLHGYKVKTTNGCNGRAHAVQLVIARVDDPSDKIAFSVNVQDCTEYNHDISPEFNLQGGKEYDASLTVNGFNPNERVEGTAGALYSIFFLLDTSASNG